MPPPLPMAFLASLGGGEVIVIFVITLILFGPHRLPEIARTIGRWYARLQRALSEFQQQLMSELPPVDDTEKPNSGAQDHSYSPPEEPPPAG